MAHGSCPHCGRAFRTKKARIIAERRAAVIADLRDGIPAEHLRPVDYSVTKPDHSDAKAKAARVRTYKQTGNLQEAA